MFFYFIIIYYLTIQINKGIISKTIYELLINNRRAIIDVKINWIKLQ